MIFYDISICLICSTFKHRQGGDPMEGSPYPYAKECEDGSDSWAWLWAMDAPALKLPKDVGLAVGPSAGKTHFVLQVGHC